MILEVNKLSKHFGQKKVFDDITFSLNKGELLLLAGENGSGKSTLMRIIAGLITQDKGTFSVEGKLSLSPASEHDFFPNATMKENLIFFAGLHKIKNNSTSEKAKALCSDLNLTAMFEKPFQELSTGNKKKFSLVRSLLLSPKLLLLDEFLGPIDQETRPQIFKYIQDWIIKNDACVLMSTHSLQDDYLSKIPKLFLK